MQCAERTRCSGTVLLAIIAVALGLGGATGRARAGGPLMTVAGRAVIYDSADFPIPYWVDQGPLGQYSNELAMGLVISCFETWQNVATATVAFELAGPLPTDIDGTNYSNYLSNFNDGINPVIFDSDGSIIDNEYGVGASDSIIGFAGSVPLGSSGNYVEGMVVLNGTFTEYFTYEQFKATFVHEFGHFIGLDHCQINLQYVQDDDTDNDRFVPTMFPTSTDDDTSLGELNPDDEAAVTLLYPVRIVSLSPYGMIRGTVTRRDGSAVQGANVVAVKTGDEDTSRFSSISDYYRQRDGAFEMLVTPGNYKLLMEPVNEAFTGGSSVGPFADDLNQASFINPVRKEYYNGEDESSYEPDLGAFETISVGAGETVFGVDFIAEEDTPPDSTTTTTAADTTTTTTAPGTTTTTTAGAGSTTTTICPPGLPVNCGNGYCCPEDYPYCGSGPSAGSCFEFPPCPVVLMFGERSLETDLIRSFRDDILTGSDTGVRLEQFYYDHADELYELLRRDRRLRATVRRALRLLMPVLRAALRGAAPEPGDELLEVAAAGYHQVVDTAGPELAAQLRDLLRGHSLEDFFYAVMRPSGPRRPER